MNPSTGSDAPPAGQAPTRPVWGARFESAFLFASGRHFGQIRKGNGSPYITHPLAVAAIVGEFGGDEEQAIAALLHDLLEDCGVTEAEIESRFGTRVSRIVLDCTDTTDSPKPPWRERKEAYLAGLVHTPADSRLVITADKLHNAESIVRDLARKSVGDKVWTRFRVDRAQELWYFRAVCDALGQGWEHELLDELRRVVALLG